MNRDVVGTLADAVSTALGGGTHALQCCAFVNEDCCYIEFSFFGLPVVLLLPVCDCGAEELFEVFRRCLLGEACPDYLI